MEAIYDSLDPCRDDYAVGFAGWWACSSFRVEVHPETGEAIVAWSAAYDTEHDTGDLARPAHVCVEDADDPRIPYGLPLYWRDDVSIAGHGEAWSEEDYRDATATSARWDLDLRAAIQGALTAPDCEDCGARGQGSEWDLTDRLLCYDCAQQRVTNVPHHWHVDGE